MRTTSGSVLGLFAKEPSAGLVKTRLAQGTSPEWARRIAEAFLEDSLDRLAVLTVPRVIAYAPASATGYFARWSAAGYELLPQCEGDLGERLKHFFGQHQEQGFSRVIAVGADSPTLPLTYIGQAFQALETTDVVIGPSFDGGYYLIGSSGRDFSIFADIPWSTAQVLEKTVERVRSANARLSVLPPWYDVDTVEDWAMLRGHVLALRHAGIDPAVPRIEKLLREQRL